VLYPALCWLFSGGDPYLLLWVMPAVNLVVFAGLAGLGAFLALRHGSSAWWGLTLPLILQSLLPLLRDLTDSLSILLACLLLAAWLLRNAREATAWETVFLGGVSAASMLCREQNLLLAGILVVAAGWRRDRSAVFALAASVVVWLGWVAYLWIGYGERPFLPSADNFQGPLAGLLWRWRHLPFSLMAPSGTVLMRISLIHLTGLLGLGAYCGWCCWPACSSPSPAGRPFIETCGATPGSSSGSRSASGCWPSSRATAGNYRLCCRAAPAPFALCCGTREGRSSRA
jgi:hypothetical protein